MAEVASAYVSLLPSARGFGSQLESEVGGDVDRAGVSLGARLGAGLGKAAAAAVATLGGVAIAAGSVGIKTAAQLEQAQIGFTTMLGSGEKAQAFLTDLSAFAGKTPFEFPELQTAASSLVSVGVSADKVIPIMTSLGNATSGMGTGSAGIQRATVALQQMNAAGKITGEDLNQLRDAGIPVYDLLAAATGKSVAAVAELAQAGKLGKTELDQLMGALESGAGLERFTGLMEQQSASLNGVWSTLKDTFSMGMADAIQPLIPLIKDGLGGATAFLTAQMPLLKTGLADAVVGVQSFVAGLQMQGPIDGFTGRLNTLGLGVRALIDSFRSPDVTSDGFVGVMEQIGSATRGVYDAIQSFLKGGGLTEFGHAFDGVGGSVSTLVPVVQQFVASMPSITDVVSVGASALAFFADHADLLAKAMPLLVGAVVAYKVAQLASNIAVAASPAIRLLEVAATRAQAAAIRELVVAQRGAAASQIATNVVTESGAAAASIGAAATIRQRVATVASAAAQKAMAIGTGIATAAQWAWNAALTANPIGIVIVAVAALVAALVWFFTQTEVGQKIVAVAWAGIKTAVAAVADWFTSTIPALWNNIKSWTVSAWTSIVDFFKAVPGRILSFFLNWTLPGLLLKHWDDIKSGAVAGFTALVEFVRGVPGRIVTALGNLGSLMLSVGSDLMQGLINGIKNKVGAAVSAVKDAVGSVISGAKNLLGIASPSKVFREIGEFTGQGFRLGIESEQAAIAAATDKMVAIPSVANRNLSGVGVGVGQAVSTREYTVNSHNYERPLGPADVVQAFRAMAVLDPAW